MTMNNYYITVYYNEENAEAATQEYHRTCFCLNEALDVVRRLPKKWDVTEIKISIR